jgi:Spy/CpxP family protein refolding chaperone
MLKKAIITGSIIVLSLSLLTFAGCRHRGHHGGAAFMIDYLSEALDLSETQQAQLDEIKQEMFAQAREMHAEKRARHDEFMALIRSEQIDPAQMRALVAEHRARMDEFVDMAIDRVVAFHSTLTPEQKEKLAGKIEKFHRYHGRGFE